MDGENLRKNHRARMERHRAAELPHSPLSVGELPLAGEDSAWPVLAQRRQQELVDWMAEYGAATGPAPRHQSVSSFSDGTQQWSRVSTGAAIQLSTRSAEIVH